jgi:hypothetical protein
MGPIKKDRLDPKYSYIVSLSPEEVAWEFLRRNDNYVQDYRAEQFASSTTSSGMSSATRARKWGYDFLVDPDCPAADTLILWQPERLARLVRLSPTPYGADCLVRFEPGRWGGRQLGQSVPDGYHMVVAPALGAEHHSLLTCAEPPRVGTPLTPLPAFDAWHPERLAATLAFWRFAQYPRVTRAHL